MPSPITTIELIKSSMRLAGIIAASETPSADEANDALAVLNDMLDAWAVENLMLFRLLDQPFSLAGGQQIYTIGAGGDFNTVRPVGIDGAYVNYAGIDFPLRKLNTDQWNAIALKALQSPLPMGFYYDPAMPLGNLMVWPVPTSAMSITLSTGMQFSQPVSLATTLIYPPGYAKVVRWCLAAELLPEFGMPADAKIEATARTLLGRLKAANRQQPVAPLDPLLAQNTSYGVADFLAGN